jgi:hypothetical protein
MGCGSSSASQSAKTPEGDVLPTTIEHEPCDVGSSSAQKTDSNGDGKPDIIRVMSGGRETCRVIDLNHDNVPDTYIYFDSNGAVRRRESDFDRDGKIDEVEQFVGGVVARRDRETNLDGKFDTWDFYVGGKLHHRMRDSDGDGKVDQWWTWANPDKLECAVIASDHNGDGKPDPADVIDVCAAPPTTSGAPGSAGGDGGAPVSASVADSGSAAGDAASGSSAVTAVPDAGAVAPGAQATGDGDAGGASASKKSGKTKKGAK